MSCVSWFYEFYELFLLYLLSEGFIVLVFFIVIHLGKGLLSHERQGINQSTNE